MRHAYLPLTALLLACGSTSVPPCTVTQDSAGSAVISCPDGSTATVASGQDGDNGEDGKQGAVPTVLEGSITIHNTLDVAALASITHITGDVEISSELLTNISLPALETVDGEIYTDECDQLATLALPKLKSARYGISIHNCPELVSIDFSNLTTIGALPATLISTRPSASLAPPKGNLYVSANEILVELSLPALSFVEGDFEVSDNLKLESILAPKLASVGDDVVIFYSNVLDTIDLSELASVGSELSLYHLPSLANLDGIPQLLTIGDTLEIYENDALTDISALLSLKSLGGDVYVQDNPLLCQITVAELIHHLESVTWGGSDESSGNKFCPPA